MRFLDHTQRHTTFGRNPLDEWSARRIDLYLTIHNTHKKQTNIHAPVRFAPAIPGSERSQTHALDRAATGNGKIIKLFFQNLISILILRNSKLSHIQKLQIWIKDNAPPLQDIHKGPLKYGDTQQFITKHILHLFLIDVTASWRTARKSNKYIKRPGNSFVASHILWRQVALAKSRLKFYTGTAGIGVRCCELGYSCRQR